MKIYRKISKYNYSSRGGADIDYIVIHWVGAVSSARDNALYFYGGDRQASAHFFVDDSQIWQSVEEKNASWHCGGGRQSANGGNFFGKCKNANSIGIEICCKKKDGKLYIPEANIKLAGTLVKALQKKYGIPNSRVIRHYDVTGKACPGGYTSDTKWAQMKKILCGVSTKTTYSGAFPTATVNSATGTVANIKRWQKFLKWGGFYSGEVDGSFGSKTVSATKKFQTKVGLTADGSAGNKTITKARTYSK